MGVGALVFPDAPAFELPIVAHLSFLFPLVLFHILLTIRLGFELLV